MPFLDVSTALIFGGCCSNVWTLEALLKYESAAGLLITFFQLFLTALFALPSQLELSSTPSSDGNSTRLSSTQPAHEHPLSALVTWLIPLRLRKPAIPFPRLLLIAVLFTSINLLNNYAFAFDISVPLHIVLRSFGSATTMFVGYFFGKRYTSIQILSIFALTVGVVISAFADALQKGADTKLSLTKHADTGTGTFLVGLVILLVAQFMSAAMGVYVERTYAKYGRHWRENLFYSHALGVAGAFALLPTLRMQATKLWSGPPIRLPALSETVAERLPISFASQLLPAEAVSRLSERLTFLSREVDGWGMHVAPYSPSMSALLVLLNGVTQVACISGVNRLSAQTTALTVTVVLNIRKLVSFLLSCVLFGNHLSGMMILGAAVVFLSGGVYGWDGATRARHAGAGAAASSATSEKGEKPNGLVKRSGWKADRKAGGVRVNSVTLRRENIGSFSPSEETFPNGTSEQNTRRRTRKSVTLNLDGLGLNGSGNATGTGYDGLGSAAGTQVAGMIPSWVAANGPGGGGIAEDREREMMEEQREDGAGGSSGGSV